MTDPFLQRNKSEQKTKKQVKALINRTIFGFKTLIWIAFAVSLIGLVCMFGISYGFYRPVVGFMVMLLFEICSFSITILAVNRMKEVKVDNELFYDADPILQQKFDSILSTYSFVSFFMGVSAVLLSLPLVLFTSDYVEGVITIQSYFVIFFIGIVLLLAVLFLKCRKLYTAWITDQSLPSKETTPTAQKIRKMSALQIGFIALASSLFLLAPYGEIRPTNVFSLFDVIVLAGIACLIASIVCFAVFMIKQKADRKKLLLPGIRNEFLILCALLISEMHDVVWFHGVEASRCDDWHVSYLWYAAIWAIIIFAFFSLIDEIIKKKSL